jgi:uncharacterized repeat protein (TIGR01451 family)
MFTLMPYENSLVVMRMNGPQLKAVLERGFFNFDLWRKGQARYTTCFLDTSGNAKVTFDPTVPEGEDNVVSLLVNDHVVNFKDADTYYNVSTVNYLAAGACQYSDAGVSLWPLSQIVADTQYYVRDAVIEYIKAHTPVSPQVEGRVRFLQPAISVTIDDRVDPVHVSNPIRYTIRVKNTGETLLRNLVVTSALPAGTRYISASPGGVFGEGTVTWTVGNMLPNTSRTLLLELRKQPYYGGKLVCTVIATSAEATATDIETTTVVGPTAP